MWDMGLAGIDHLEYCQVLYFIDINLYLDIDRWKYGHKQQWLSNDPPRT